MCKNECLLGYLEVLRQTLENYGIPISLYPDKYSVFFPQKKVDDHITVEEQLNGREKGVTQFGRIVEELGIDIKESDLEFKLVETLKSYITFFFFVKNFTGTLQNMEPEKHSEMVYLAFDAEGIHPFSRRELELIKNNTPFLPNDNIDL